MQAESFPSLICDLCDPYTATAEGGEEFAPNFRQERTGFRHNERNHGQVEPCYVRMSFFHLPIGRPFIVPAIGERRSGIHPTVHLTITLTY